MPIAILLAAIGNTGVIFTSLKDIRVIDLTNYVAGPHCAKLLADYGADVIKVEHPGEGDPSRKAGPFPGDKAHLEKSALFLNLNTSKRGITLNVQKPEGADILKRLIARADILVESFHPGTMAKLGMSYDALTASNPNLVMVSITDFGQWGPYSSYRGSELVDYAIGGAMYSGGAADRQPLKLGGSVVQFLAGAHGAASAMVALAGRALRGRGEHVDISIMETQAGSPDRRTPMLLGYQFTGLINKRGQGVPPSVRPAKDGYLNIQFGIFMIDRIAKMLGKPEMAKDPRFADPTESSKPENIALLEELYLTWLGKRTLAQAWDAAQKAGVLSGPIYTMADLMKDGHLKARDFWEDIAHPVAGKHKYPGRPFTSRGDRKPPRRPAPRLGQHNEEVYKDLGYEKKDLERLQKEGVI